MKGKGSAVRRGKGGGRQESKLNTTEHPNAREARTAASKRRMLAAFLESGSVRAACVKAGIGRTVHYLWLQNDPEYVASFTHALADRADILEEEATRRGVKGWLEPIYFAGKAVGAVRKYSDALLLARLKAELPEKYRERHDFNLSRMTDEQLIAWAKAEGLPVGAPGEAAPSADKPETEEPTN